MAEAYIVATARTAGGRKGGRLSGWHPADLAATVLNSLVERTGADPAQIEDVIMGCVMQAGEQSNNIARNAIMASRLPESVPGTSIDRQCGSSQQALHFAAQAVMSGSMDCVIAAGVESMTRVPMGTPSVLAAKAGLGHYKSPGIEQRYPNIVFSQFTGAEMMAEKYGLSKDQLDEYSYNSHQRAIAATQAGRFKDEIIPLQITRADGITDTHTIDEGIRFDVSLDGIKGVKLIAENGKLSAASASQICDGASGVLVVNERGLVAARTHHQDVGSRNGALALGDAALDLFAGIGARVPLDHHHVLHQYLARLAVHAQNAAGLAFIAPGDHLDGVFPLDIDADRLGRLLL